MSGSTWGSSKDTLTHAYTTYILPVLTYGQELLINSSDNVTHPLNVVQNQALRFITGGVKSSPIDAMEAVTNIEPLWLQREKSALKMYERIKRTPNSLWNGGISFCSKTQKKIIL